MLVWIDILTPKQFWFFTSLEKRLKALGLDVMLTSRRYEQVLPLIEAVGRDDIIIVGEYGGGSLEGKLRASIARSMELAEHIINSAPALAVSSGSPEAARIAYGLAIPHILASDTPHSPVNSLCAPLSRRIFTPWIIGKTPWTKYGVRPRSITLYRGLDPIAWLDEMPHDKSVLRQYDLRENNYIVIRGSEFKAAYLGEEYLTQFIELVRKLAEVSAGYDVVVMPRYGDEVKRLEDVLDSSVKIVKKPVVGSAILRYSSSFIGGGGTMTQEAALMGVPVFSIYPKKLPEVISFLIRQGLVKRPRNVPSLVQEVKRILRDVDYFKERYTRLARRIRETMRNPAVEIAHHIKRSEFT
ncbi:MAG: DUF354 domain-containing protein [Aigarchaeota archaeon]|nr:DUF354 domain-containing protein [Candidatus Pelearchaeum maunauluense]